MATAGARGSWRLSRCTRGWHPAPGCPPTSRAPARRRCGSPWPPRATQGGVAPIRGSPGAAPWGGGARRPCPSW
eukprot:941401-Lingulodinium_polyedra.AAC.1